ncbi:hypothetical protein OIV83_004168 [Microbotryomycetes sp. JL201]|nr:hypothetical protein OIV83_004168 [Microbotryomycetes sp. JL201]
MDDAASVASTSASVGRWQHRKQLVDDYISRLSGSTDGSTRGDRSGNSTGPSRRSPPHGKRRQSPGAQSTLHEEPRQVWETQGWMSASSGPHEDERRRILERFHLKSVGQVRALDRVAQLAQTMFSVPLVAVTLSEGAPKSTTFPLNSAFFASEGGGGGEADLGIVVEDVRDDYRFRNHPWMEDGRMVFLAASNIYLPTRASQTPTSTTLALPSHLPVGSLCVIDKERRPKESFDTFKLQTLKSLADMIGHEFELAFERQRAHAAGEQAAYLGELFRSQMVFSSSRGAPKVLSADDHQTVVETVCKLLNADTAALIDLRLFHAPEAPGRSDSPESPNGNLFTRRSSPESVHTTGSQEWYTKSAAKPGRADGLFGQVTVAASNGFDWATHFDQKGATAAIHHFLFAYHSDGNSEFDTSTIPSPLADVLPPDSRASLSVPVFDSAGQPVFLLILCSFRRYFRFEAEDRIFVENVGAVLIANILRKRVIDADRAKLSFVSQVSHELRTPLFAVGGQLELIRQLTKSYPNVQKTLAPLLDVAEVCVSSLKEVLDDTLEFSKISSKVEGQDAAPPPALTEVHLGTLVEDVVKSVWARVRQAASASGNSSRGEVSILLENKLKRPRAVVDVGGLKRVLFNTIGNALKFTDKGHVKIKLTSRSIEGGSPTGLSNLLIQVSDTGRGMSQNFIDTCLFVPFKQADEFSQGAGLGVSISEAICRRMKGSLQYTSAVGKGTTATITFPVELLLPLPNDAPSLPVVRNLSEELNAVFNPITNGRSTRPNGPSPQPSFTTKFGPGHVGTATSDSMATPTVERPSPPLNDTIRLSPTIPGVNSTRPTVQLRVLVVDDNPIGRKLLTTLLRTRSIEFVDACDGLEGVERFKSFGPNLVWCDMQMPVMDGVEATRLMREYEVEMCWPKARIVAISGFSGQDRKTKHLLDSGQIDEWLTKGGPTNLKQLAAGLDEYKAELQNRLVAAETAGDVTDSSCSNSPVDKLDDGFSSTNDGRGSVSTGATSPDRGSVLEQKPDRPRAV